MVCLLTPTVRRSTTAFAYEVLRALARDDLFVPLGLAPVPSDSDDSATADSGRPSIGLPSSSARDREAANIMASLLHSKKPDADKSSPVRGATFMEMSSPSPASSSSSLASASQSSQPASIRDDHSSDPIPETDPSATLFTSFGDEFRFSVQPIISSCSLIASILQHHPMVSTQAIMRRLAFLPGEAQKPDMEFLQNCLYLLSHLAHLPIKVRGSPLLLHHVDIVASYRGISIVVY
jgi:hypothetical protein